MVNEYETGLSMGDIAVKLDCGVWAIHSALKRANIPVRRRSRVSNHERNLAASAYLLWLVWAVSMVLLLTR